ncbi:MAG: hypothetical protein ACKO66_07365 [Flavobacteriales bacterium]
MILRLYSTTQPHGLFAIIIMMLLILVPCAWMNGLPLVSTGFHADWMFGFLRELPALQVPVAFALIAGGAFAANALFNRHDFFNTPVYHVALAYAMIATSMSLIRFEPSVLLSNLILLAGINSYFKIGKQAHIHHEVFTSSIFFGTATLLHPPYAATLFSVLLTCWFIRGFHFKEFIITLIGFGTPWLYWFSFCYVTHRLETSVPFTLPGTYTNQWMLFNQGPWVELFYAALASAVLLALIRYILLNARLSNKAKALKNVLLLLCFCLISGLALQFWMTDQWGIGATILPFTFLLGYWFTHYKVTIGAPFLYYVLGICSIFLILHRFGILPA